MASPHALVPQHPALHQAAVFKSAQRPGLAWPAHGRVPGAGAGSSSSGDSDGGGNSGGVIGAATGTLHDATGGGHHDPSDVGGMSNLLDVGLTGHHHTSTGHHFHHGRFLKNFSKNLLDHTSPN